ncbi:MAG: hypothetical protein LBG25_02540, partial [Spirochaetaceae bacterium]|nr:hypothetical protein [Spirochaetaceae bacterium]
LKEWILTHIAISDKNFFEHFKKIATRNADGTLSIPIPPPDTITASTEETDLAVPEEQKPQVP